MIKMDYIVPISEARGKLPLIIKQMSKIGKHFIITRNGRAEVVMISPEELETLEIKADIRALYREHLVKKRKELDDLLEEIGFAITKSPELINAIGGIKDGINILLSTSGFIPVQPLLVLPR